MDSSLEIKARNFLDRSGIHPKKIYPLKAGISNFNLLVDDTYVLKIPYDDHFIFMDEGQIEFQNKLYELGLSTKIINFDIEKGLLLTKYIDNLKQLNPNTFDTCHAYLTSKAIKMMNALKVDNLKPLDYNNLLDRFRLGTPIEDRIYVSFLEHSPILDRKKVPSHFDLVDNNILFRKDSSPVILDFEFACQAPIYFDLTSLISENDFPLTSQDRILSSYFENNKEAEKQYLTDKDEYCALLDLLWYHWAQARKKQADDNFRKRIYSQIALSKYLVLKKEIKNLTKK